MFQEFFGNSLKFFRNSSSVFFSEMTPGVPLGFPVRVSSGYAGVPLGIPPGVALEISQGVLWECLHEFLRS